MLLAQSPELLLLRHPLSFKLSAETRTTPWTCQMYDAAFKIVPAAGVGVFGGCGEIVPCADLLSTGNEGLCKEKN
jgi:hypothetical protein